MGEIEYATWDWNDQDLFEIVVWSFWIGGVVFQYGLIWIFFFQMRIFMRIFRKQEGIDVSLGIERWCSKDIFK